MVISLKKTKYNKRERTERIKAVRMLLGLTQKQFAETLGMSREGYQKLERGENNISTDVLEKLNHIYGISADYLLYGDFQDEEKVWNMVRNCSETAKMDIMIRLIAYFTTSRKVIYPDSGFSLEDFLKKVNIGDKRS